MPIDLRPVTRSKTVQVPHHALPQASLGSKTALEQFARLRDNRLCWLGSGKDTQGLQARQHLRRLLGLAGLQEASPFFKRGQPGIAGPSHRPVPPATTAGAVVSLATA